MKSNSEKLLDLVRQIELNADNLSPTKKAYPADVMLKWARAIKAVARDLERKDEAIVGDIEIGLGEDGGLVFKFIPAPGKDLWNNLLVKKLVEKV